MFYAYIISCFSAVMFYTDCTPPIKPGVETRFELVLGPHGPDRVACESVYSDGIRKSYTAEKQKAARTPEERSLKDYRQLKYVCIYL